MMFSWILISLLVRFLKAQGKLQISCYMAKSMRCSLYKHSSSHRCVLLSSEIVVYAQIGGTAILPKGAFVIPNTVSSLYVNWYRGLDSTNPIISKNPQSGIQKGEMHTVLRHHNNQATMFAITEYVCLSFVGKDVKTHASLLPDFSLRISPVQDFDFEVWRCEQHVLTDKNTKIYKLYHGKTKYRECVSAKQKVEKHLHFSLKIS